MKMRFIYLLLGISLMMFGCTKSFDKKIADHIKEKCPENIDNKDCVIDLNDVTDFEWDSLYVIGGLMTVNEINQIIGFNCNCRHLKDNYDRIIFTKDKRIVLQSDYYGLDSEIQFRPLKIDSLRKYSKDESKFYVIKKPNTLTSGYFYDLYPISRIN